MGGREAQQHERIWRVTIQSTGKQWEGPLVAYWQVELDPISDEYTPHDIEAQELLFQWAKEVRRKHEDLLIPIRWSVYSPGQAKRERMPFQFHGLGYPDFLTYYTRPVSVATGEPLNWLELPVVDKFWNKQRADKGGFIQQATGWKPSILQPYVYLPALLSRWESEF